MNHAIGALHQRLGDRHAERLGGSEIDNQFEFAWALHGQIARVRAFENPVDVDSGPAVDVREAWPIGHQSSRLGKPRERTDRR